MAYYRSAFAELNFVLDRQNLKIFADKNQPKIQGLQLVTGAVNSLSANLTKCYV